MKKSLKKFDRGVSLLSWAYNEEDSIEEFLQQIITLLEATIDDYEIILVDDGSSDRTWFLAKAVTLNNPKVKLVQNKKNLDVGLSFRRAIQMAEKEFLFWQTVDWSYDISDLRTHLEELKYYDIIQGVRQPPAANRGQGIPPVAFIAELFDGNHLRQRSDTVFKAIISVINYLVVRLLFNIPLSDFQNITVHRTKWLKSLDIESFSSFTNPELLIKAHWNGMSIKEVPINFIPRKKGRGKGTRLKAIKNSVRDIVRLWIKWILVEKRHRTAPGRIERLT